MINCEQTFDDPAFFEVGSHLAKSNSTAQYHYGLDEIHGNNVLLVSDCCDAQVQLYPRTIVDRYLHINSRANDRLDLFISNNSAEQTGIYQDIILRTLGPC